jgi:hypothetical protein
MSVSGERELEEFLQGALSGRVEEAPPAEETEREEQEEVVYDDPDQRDQPEDDAPTPTPSPEEEQAPEAEEQEVPAEEEGDPAVVWATKKYGKDTAAWAKAARDQEAYISRLAGEKKQAEDVARQAIEYAQQTEQQSASALASSMPLSASEEAWVEQNMGNPAAAAYQAARAGNANLYNAVLEQVALDNPSYAAQIGTQVSLALQEEANAYRAQQAAEQNGGQPQDFNTDLGQSFQRVGVDIQRYGQAIWEKIEELGEYHKYTLAILGGDPLQRDLAVQAVYDLVRQGQTTTTRVADSEREKQIAREGELRRNAASVVTGSPHVVPVEQSPFMQAMEEEWKRKGQWTDEE